MEAAGTGVPLAVDPPSAPPRRLLRLVSDGKLVERVRAGSEAAFAVLYERHHRGILSFCRHMLGSREEAEDAVQQSFTNAYRAVLGGENEINFKPWLYRIARNQCISVLRARHHDAELSEDEPSMVGLSDQVAQRDELRNLLRDLGGLPVDQREALVLAELHDNSHVEVAAILGCDREKVKSLVFQARSSLMTSREAREVPCEEIRRQLSVLRGGSLRRNTIRRHLQHCEGCRAFRAEVVGQRQALSVLLPVVPSATLKFGAANAVAAAGVKAASTAVGAAGAAAGGGSAAGAGPLAVLAGKLGVSAAAVKGAAATVAVTVAAGGGAVAVKEAREPSRDATPAPIEQFEDGSAAGNGSGRAAGPAAPGAPSEEGKDRGKKRSEKQRPRGSRRDRHERARTPRSRRSGAGARGGAAPNGGERSRRKAERKATSQRQAQRRQQRKAERPKRVRKRPGRRKLRPPVIIPPADPLPLDPAKPRRGTTFPSP